MDPRELAERLNQLASEIHSPADASHFVEFLADICAKQLPSAFMRRSIRNKIALAEYSAVSAPEGLIPEQRIAEAWNAYVDTIKAPEEFHVSSEEIHNLRDAFLISACLSWKNGLRNIWSVPSIYATRADGTLAPGCRAIESLRILWDLANMPDNLESARGRVRQGIVASELFRSEKEGLQSRSARQGAVLFRVTRNPVEDAARQYVQDRGAPALCDAILTMLNSTHVMLSSSPSDLLRCLWVPRRKAKT